MVSENDIGTQNNGTAALSNGIDGVLIDGGANHNTVGTSAGGNLVSGNAGHGVAISGNATSGNVLLANFIGTDFTGTAALGNTLDGVFIGSSASHNTIGGTSTGTANIIAFDAKGVVVSGNTTGGESILGNSIFSNNGPGIDLGNDGITPNGTKLPFPNDAQNTPLLTGETSTSVSGTLTSAAGSYRIEVFAYPDTDTVPDGKVFLDSTTVTIASAGIAQTFTATGLTIPDGMLVSATATNTTTGDTSEFALLATVYVVNTARDMQGDTKHLAAALQS